MDADGADSGEPSDVVGASAGPARALAAEIDAHLESWLVRCVTSVAAAYGISDEQLESDAEQAAALSAAEILPRVHQLLTADIDEQSTTPLALVRAAVAAPTTVLRERGVPPVDRDAFSVDRFPEDIYDLTPATLAELDPAVGEAAVVWGAAKAWEHRRRHGS